MKKLLLFIIVLSFLVTPVLVLASNSEDSFEKIAFLNWNPGGSGEAVEEQDTNPFNKQLNNTGEGLPSEYSATKKTNFINLVYKIITFGLSFLGIGTIGLIIYAGARWMMSRGNEDQVTEAKKTLRNAVIGLILITMAYSLSVFIGRRLQRTTGSYGTGGGFYLQILE